MSNEIPSIEDLLKKTGGSSVELKKKSDDELSASEKVTLKLEDVRLKEKEEQAKRDAKSASIPYVNLQSFPISPEALTQIPKERAEALKTVCFLFTGPEIRVASLNPDAQEVKDLLFQLQERNKAHGGLYKISQASFDRALKAYDSLPKIKPIMKGVQITDAELTEFQTKLGAYTDIAPTLKDASITDVVTIIMAAALQFGTSDVHVEAEEEKIAVRYRIDGVLQDVAELPHASWKKIISRIKLISGLKINITEKPQDGRFTIFLKEGDTDIRVSTIPTTWGESVVMRLLKPSAINVDFAKLGYRPLVEEKLRREIEKPHGMIITTGPTGSGKTTTLYAILKKLNTPDVKIITLEDPIEYKLEGLNQSQIDRAKEYTFAGGLRSILRQDPDVVMVGEIRDLETAEVAINAALTGHLMLSTLHTNDAAGALPRFISMGVKPFLLSPALNAIIGQRLARRIHEDCKESYTPTPDELKRMEVILGNIPANSGETIPGKNQWTFSKGKGCDVCNHTGYKGRVGVYELLVMSDTIRGALSEQISEYEARQLARKEGMVTMAQDGMLKVLDGVTTIEEVLRVAGDEEATQLQSTDSDSQTTDQT